MKNISEAPKTVLVTDRAWQLTVGRIFVLLILMAASIYWNKEILPSSLETFLRLPLVIFVVWLFLTLLYLPALRFTNYLFQQVAVQLVIDALMVSWLVWATGDVRSPYITFYTVLICLVGFFFTAQATLWAAIAIGLFFTIHSTLIVTGALPRLSQNWRGNAVIPSFSNHWIS